MSTSSRLLWENEGRWCFGLTFGLLQLQQQTEAEEKQQRADWQTGNQIIGAGKSFSSEMDLDPLFGSTLDLG